MRASTNQPNRPSRTGLGCLLSTAFLLLGCTMMEAQNPQAGEHSQDPGLTAVAGIEVGQHTLTERPTGCTVILAKAGAVAGVAQRGGAPGTRELGLLDPTNTVQEVHAVVLSGGSAFGLDSASGVVKYLEQQNIGYETRVARVPIVVGAILYDLPVGDKPHIRPGADCGFKAASAASSGPVEQGNVGAGAGATVGKMGGPGRSMKGGLGSASVTLENGLVVAALVAVNAVGDIIDPNTGEVVAGALKEDGSFADARKLIRQVRTRPPARSGENTTIGLVATNAKLTKAQATKVAQMADDGFSRAIFPAHTPGDGDTVFALATGTFDGPAEVSQIGALASSVMSEAILNAVRAAKGLPGIPAVRDLEP